MKPKSLILLVCSALLGGGSWAMAESPMAIEYEGRVTVAGVPYSGQGKFRFALSDVSGRQLWASGGEDDDPVSVQVNQGRYRVKLGDPAMGMPPLGDAVTSSWESLQIQTWFNDGTNGWAEAGRSALSNPEMREVAMQQMILTELRQLRTEVSSLRTQVQGLRNAQAVAKAPTRAPAPKPRPRTAAPVNVTLAEAQRQSLGSLDAPVVLVEFTDFECGYCKRFFLQTFPQLKEHYVDTGKLRFVSRQFPIKSHPQARPAALALLSGAAQKPDLYWTMREWLFENNRELGVEVYGKFARDAGLDMARFAVDTASNKFHVEKLEEDLSAGRGVGITGTPSFVLGTSDGKNIKGERIVGAKSFQVFQAKIETLLKSKASVGDSLEPKLKPDANAKSNSKPESAPE